VHGGICGPIEPATPGGKRYFLLLIDDMSRFMWLTLITSKDEAAAAIKKFKARAELESGRKLRALRTDRGGEFTSIEFGEFMAEHGIHRQLTAPYTPQQNGVVEHRNQTVVATARSMMKAKGVPRRFWGEAVHTAVYLLNRSPTKALNGVTPYEAWHGEQPSVHHLRTFGCIGHVKDVRPHLKKLADRSTPMVLLGYEQGSKAYRLYDPAGDRVHVSRDVVFDENASWDWESASTPAQGAEPLSVEYMVLPVSGRTPEPYASPMSPTPSSPAPALSPSGSPTPIAASEHTPGAASSAAPASP